MLKISLIFIFLTLTTIHLTTAARTRQGKKDNAEPTYKILITHPEVPLEAIELLRGKVNVTVCESVPPKRSEILAKIRGMHGLYWASHEPLNAEILNAAGPQLKSISTMSAGIDYVDVAELKKRKIPLGHTPTVLNNAVADLAIGLMISAARRFSEGRKKIESSTWENYHLQWMLGQDIRDSTVGFFGFGGIGQTIAKRLSGFDIDRILYTTRHRVNKDIESEFSATKVSFDEMLANSDFVFIAAPLTNETVGVFNSTVFAKMKKTAVLINISRGPIVNQNDLYNALKSNKIFSAGLDVMVPEPLPANDKLMTLPNCVIIPHLGSATFRTRNDMAIIAAHNVLRGLAGEPMFAPAYQL